jgi:hypothetical protein
MTGQAGGSHRQAAVGLVVVVMIGHPHAMMPVANPTHGQSLAMRGHGLNLAPPGGAGHRSRGCSTGRAERERGNDGGGQKVFEAETRHT